MHAPSEMPVGETRDFGFSYPSGYDPELMAKEVLIIQADYLEKALKLLEDGRASKQTRQEVIDWVALPLVAEGETKYLSALAFQRCCYAAGRDPATMQEFVLGIVAPNLLEELGYE